MDGQQIFKLKVSDDENLDEFISSMKKLADPEIVKMKERYGDINSFTESINSNSSTYYFISVFKNKKDLSYARGSIVKAMSIASRHR